MNEAMVAAIAVVVSALISGGFGWAIKRSADKASTSSTRERIEAGAFDRARSIYDNALDRAKAEIAELSRKVSEFEAQVQRLESELNIERKERRTAVETARREINNMRVDLAEREATIHTMRQIIARQQTGKLPPGIDLGNPEEPP